jgi:hypothetical protein
MNRLFYKTILCYIARVCGEKKLNFLKKFFRADGVAERKKRNIFFKQQDEPQASSNIIPFEKSEYFTSKYWDKRNKEALDAIRYLGGL